MSANNIPQQAWRTPLTSNSSVALEQLNSIRWEIDPTYGLRGYMYVQAAPDTTVNNGVPLAYVDTYKKSVTSDISDASQNQPVGVGVGRITASYYGWIQFYGYHSAVVTNGDDDIADCDSIILAATDGQCDSVPAGTASTYKIIGVAVADDINAANTVATMIDCL